MADIELIAATLATGVLSPLDPKRFGGGSAADKAADEAVEIYGKILARLQASQRSAAAPRARS